MIELIVRKIFDIGLIAIVIAFLTPLLQRLNNFFIKKFGRVFGVIIYIFSFFVVMIFLSNQTLIYILQKNSLNKMEYLAMILNLQLIYYHLRF